MTEPIPLMVELCAGTAALSLRLHRDGAKPPVSRMGSKSGYASALLRVLGLIPGQRADRYLWCEPDPGVRLLLHAYRSAPLARAAAAIIRGWAAEDPRALWERLRAEGPPRLPDGEVDAGEVARWITVGHLSYRDSQPESGFGVSKGYLSGEVREGPVIGRSRAMSALPVMPSATITPDARHIDPREVARWAQITASNRLINTAWSDAEGRWINTGDGGATFGGDAFCSPCERTAEGFDSAPGDVPAVVVPDARGVDPREVARHLLVSGWAAHGKDAAYYGGPARDSAGHPPGWTASITAEGLARRADALPAIDGALIHPDAREVDPREVARFIVDTCTSIGNLFGEGGFAAGKIGDGSPGNPRRPREMPHIAAACDRLPVIDGALIHPDARDIDPPTLPPGTVCYMDPPYLNTTGYTHDLPRSEVVALARRWAAAGATVAISEAEPIPELVAEGWYAVEITGERVGQARTFSKQKREWVTLNRPPAWVPPVQGSLF